MKKCLLEECTNLTNNPKFCSLSCGSKHQFRVNPKPKKVNMRQCARVDCENEFNAVNGRAAAVYCSRSCAATVNNLTRGQENYCLNCSRPLKTGKRYCSIECGAEFRRNRKIDKWLSGEWDGNTKAGLASFLKKYLIEVAGNRCSSDTCCVPGGFSEINVVTGKVPLEVDHIDGNCYNNRPENLKVLCPNCHALTPTYRALNKGSGRAYRGKYDQYKLTI